MSELTLRSATPADMLAITAIYGHHVQHGLASFEIEPPALDEMQLRYAAIVDAGYPYLVATDAQRVLGYAYASHYRARPAYRFTVEDSVYVAPTATGRGIGRQLLDELIVQCEARCFRQMLAVIGDSGNRASIELHRACGFAHVGLLPSIGFKFGRWVDSVLMQRALGDGDRSAPR